MSASLSDPPAANEVEVSLFGPGRGESCVVHLGQGDWIIVDSCRQQPSGKTVPLEYLRSQGVDPSKQVKLVVGTHAHDDHIAGIADVFEACDEAFFVHSSALSREEFAAIMEADIETTVGLKRRNYDEYRRVFDLIEARGLATGLLRAKHGLESRVLFEREPIGDTARAVVRSLSPSDQAVRITQQKFLDYLPTVGSGVSPPRVDPNELAVAIWVQVGNHSVLLGADLLIGPAGCGWGAVLASFAPDDRAAVYKVAHHGSGNADHPDVWAQLLDERPIAFLAPYRVSPVPSEIDRRRLCARTPLVYATADPRPVGTRAVRKTSGALVQVAKNVRDPWGLVGHLRARVSDGAAWQVQMENPARRLCR